MSTALFMSLRVMTIKIYLHKEIFHELVNISGLWNDQDGFYYDHLKIGDEPAKPLPIRSMVGLVPLFR